MTKTILASASRIRIALLRAAGVAFVARPAPIDERAVEAPLVAKGRSPAEIALALAEAKALAVSRDAEDALVIGADQTLEFGGRSWKKPATVDEAREQLLSLAGTTHQLHAGLTSARSGEVVWRHVETARLTMREMSPAFLDAYLEQVGEVALSSVGAYQLEGRGIQLFEKIEGDYFAVLGLPLLPLLEHLRVEGALPR